MGKSFGNYSWIRDRRRHTCYTADPVWKKGKTMKKKWIILLYSLVMAAAVGASIYEFYRKGSLDQSNLTRTILIVAGALLGMVKNLNRNKVSFAKKQELYEKTYASHIGNAFSNMPKEKKAFFRSLDDFNDDKYTSAIKKLEALNESCRALSEQQLYEKAIHRMVGVLPTQRILFVI